MNRVAVPGDATCPVLFEGTDRLLPTEGVEGTDELQQLPSKGEGAFEICSKRETAKVLRAYIEQLAPRLREVVKLYYFEDLQLKEIGRRLGVGEARVSQILKQAGTDLRRLMEAGKRTPAKRVSTLVQ